jgi:hypothetical protein
MKRILIVLAAVLVLPGVAAAHRQATGATRAAIERLLHFPLPGEPQGCVWIEQTTRDGGSWATTESARPVPACRHWQANDYVLVHRAHGRWRQAGGGDGPLPCAKLRIPIAVRQDLKLACGNSPFG